MSAINVIVGATSPEGATVVVKVDGGGPVRLLVADNPSIDDGEFTASIAVDAQGVAKVPITAKAADTEYWFIVEDNDEIDGSLIGHFHTHPLENLPADFTFAVASCAGSNPTVPGQGSVLEATKLSNSPVFTDILNQNPLWFSHMGDLHYYDLGTAGSSVATGTLANYRRSYDDVLLQSAQEELYRNVALQYMWDDHDFGPNNSDGTLPDKANAQAVYRERVPSYPLPDASSVYHSWVVGRVQFVALDCRSERSPNTDPDDGDKTMLGAAQKAWLNGVLANSTSEYLVVITTSTWVAGGSGVDTWDQFSTERDDLITMFTTHGWIDRMLMVMGDRHYIGIASGAEIPGGIPIGQFAALDCTNGTTPGEWFDIGTNDAFGQYGTVRLQDKGDEITVTLTGWEYAQTVKSFTYTVQTSTAFEPPADTGEVLPVGVVSPVVQWQAFDLVSGELLADLPEVVDGEISRVLGEYTSAELSIPLPMSGPAAINDVVYQATTPRRTMVVAIVNDQPAWGGIVVTRDGGSEATLTLGCVTLEGYLARRTVGSHSWTNKDESVIAKGLLADAGDISGVGSGINLEIDAPPTGKKRTFATVASDRSSVYEKLQALMALEGGPEWTIELVWEDDTHTRLRKVFRVRSQLGIISSEPSALFETTSNSVFESEAANETRYRLVESYEDGMGANYVVAFSSGEGEDQPESDPFVDTDQLALDVPIYERHWEPDSSVTSKSVLNEYARQELVFRKNGTNTWDIEARWNVFPRLNIDWRLGDTIAWDMRGHRHPDGAVGQGRCIGWTLSPRTGLVHPILLDPTSGG